MTFHTLLLILRRFRTDKFYSAVNILGLTLGITCSLMLGLYIHSELSYDTHHANHERIYRIVNEFVIQGRGEAMALSSRSLGPLLQSDYPEQIVSYTRFRPLSLDERPAFRHESTAFYWDDVFIADPNVFQVFSHEVMYGDPQSALDDPASIAISESMSLAYFGEVNPVGEVLTSGLDDYRVSLVFKDLPDNSHLKYTALLSINQLEPMPEDEASLNRLLTDTSLYTYLVMNESFIGDRFGLMLERFSEDRIAPMVAELGLQNTSMRFWAQNLADIHLNSTVSIDEPTGNIAYPLGFTAIAVLILGTASVNYMNLSTARFIQRAKEVGIRKVLGASRMQLVGMILSEAILFTLTALVVSMILVGVLLSYSVSETAVGISLSGDVLYQQDVLLVVVSSALLVGLLAGAYPAWRLSSATPIAALATKGRQAKSTIGIPRYALVLSQFTISISIIAAVFLMTNQMQYLANLPLGFEKENKILVNIQGTDLIESYPALRNELLSTPFVRNVSIAQDVPGDRLGAYGLNIENENGEIELQMMIVMRVGAEFIETMGMNLVQGRSLSALEQTDSGGPIVVNEALVSRMGWSQPIGKQIRGFMDGTIVGVVEDFNFASLHQNVEPQIFVLMDDDFSEMSAEGRSRVSRSLILNITADTEEQLTDALTAILGRFDPNLPIEFSLLDVQLDQMYSSEGKAILLVSLFSAICVFIGCLGLFGLTAFTTEQRTKEIGIRKILGASVAQLLWLLTRNVFIVTAIAGALAPIGTIPVVNRWLESFAYRASFDLFSFPLATLMVLFIALATISMQLTSTIRSNPIDAMRYE